MYDIVIIGAGPAGLTAAIYARRASKSVLVLEAMSYGNCCLVSDILECTEVVEDKAVVFSKGNVDELRNKLQELLDKPEIVQKYRSSVARFITSKYNWDDVVDKTLELYVGK